MKIISSKTYPVRAEIDIVNIRQAARSACNLCKFSLVDQTKLVTAASELARNTVVYGGGGTALLEQISEGIRVGVRLTFEDNGPGISDIERALGDGYTSGNGLGLGLGGSRRLVNDFDIKSVVGKGTTVTIAMEMMHDVQDFLAFEITDISGAGEVRRRAVSLAQKLSFDEHDCSDLAIIAAELAKNTALHAGTGKVLLRVLTVGDARGIELLAIDKGPGMRDVSLCMRDGYSTAGTHGTGLGAISRLSSTFDIYSRRDEGTVVQARLWPRAVNVQHLTNKGLEVGVIQMPKRGETLCGDAHAIAQDGDSTIAIVADGLGHGLLAHQASTEAIRLFHAHRNTDMVHIMQVLHGGLRATRGAAVSLLECDLQNNRVRFVGVGNVAGHIVGDSLRTLACGNGTVGHIMRKPTEFSYEWPANGIFVMHTDGLTTSWRLDAYPGLRERHCSVIAGVLYRDFDRGRDDVTVIVARPSQKEQHLV